MGGMFGSTVSQSDEKFGALRFSSSTQGATIPVVGGQNRVPANVVWYGDFQAIPHTSSQAQGGKGGVTTNSTSYTYQAGMVLGICHGPVGEIVKIWRDKEKFTGGYLQSQLATATETYTVPASGAMTYTLAKAATLQTVSTVSYSVVRYGKTTVYPLAEGRDYSVSSGGLLTVLLNVHRGRVLTIVYVYGTGTPGKTPAQQLGLTLMRGDVGQAPMGWLSTAHPDQVLGYSGMSYAGAQTYQLGNSAQVQNHVFEVRGFGSGRYTGTPDCNPADFVAEVLGNGRFGARMPSATISVSLWSDYCAAAGLLMSPALTSQIAARDFVNRMAQLTNSAAIWSVDTLKVVPYGDQSLTGNGVTYSPAIAAVYQITDDGWLAEPGADPVTCEQRNIVERFNSVELQYADRANDYAPAIAKAFDDADIRTNGLHKMQQVIDGSWICTPDTARASAQLILQRAMSVTGTYRFALPWAYCLLEPMDVVQIVDPVLGMLTVRITEIEEGEDGAFTIVAEDCPIGASTAITYPAQGGGGYLHDYNASPGSVDAPVIFEAPEELTSTGLEVWVAVDGSGPNWGGCDVWVSSDGSNYKLMGSALGGARYGMLTAAAGASGTISVTSSGALINASSADASSLGSLIYIGGPSPEYAAYTTATLTGSNAYTLTVPVRGAYSTTAAAHDSGAPFVRVDSAIVKSDPLSLSQIGQQLWFKFTSQNQYGGAKQSLADVDPYTYTITGAIAKIPPANVPWVQAQGQAITFGTITGAQGYRIRAAVYGSTDWASAMPLHDGLVTVSPYSPAIYPPGTVTLMTKAVDKLGNESVTAAMQAGVTLKAGLYGNVSETFAQSPTFPGTITGGATVVGGVLTGNPVPSLFWGVNTAAFWGADASLFWPASANSSTEFSYTFTVTTSRAGWLVLGESVSGAYSVTYSRTGSQLPFFGSDTAVFWGADASLFWPADPAVTMRQWPGAVQAAPRETYQITITVALNSSGVSTVNSLTPYIDSPTIRETITDFVVPLGGTRLAPVNSFTNIRSLSLALKNTASGAASVVYEDLLPSGPFVECYAIDGSLATGTIGGEIVGY